MLQNDIFLTVYVLCAALCCLIMLCAYVHTMPRLEQGLVRGVCWGIATLVLWNTIFNAVRP